jgi:hypothetical protein
MFFLRQRRQRLLIAFAWLMLASCRAMSHHTSFADARSLIPLHPVGAPAAVTRSEISLAPPQACSNAFITHTLDHITQTHGEAVHQFETNGAGVAVNDLNNDGLLDIVFANLNGNAEIFWNRGNLLFDKQILDDYNTRAVNIVDVDGDGRMDIVFTHTASGLSIWHNEGADGAQTRFVLRAPRGIAKPAYAMAWADLNGDGALDVVTGSYDAELNLQQGSAFLFSDGAGVFYYAQRGASATEFIPQRLAKASQALAIALFDFNGDGKRDIVVGNDFEMRDMAWRNANGNWQAAEPFSRTSEQTMSLDWGDIDNNGNPALFATDMKPYDIGVETLAKWLPMMSTQTRHLPESDPQRMENVLQVYGADGQFHNAAQARGVSATGWSWSGKFGDLNNDGFLDLYVVNGMINADLLHYLPNDELVEENQALRNQGDGTFVLAPEWKLGSTASGRGMSMADLNNDGRLDIVVNNLRSPAQLFENQICNGNALEVDLRETQRANRFAIGAQLILRTSAGTYTRDVRASSGYLSGDATRVHFGIPKNATLEKLDVIWDDGSVSTTDKLNVNTLLTLTR